MKTPQAPLDSPFDASSTAADVLRAQDLRGSVAIVTGGYSGIGTETVRALCSAGASVVVPARNETKARAALAGIDGVTLESLDLAEPESIDGFSERFLASGRPLHWLVNNAGGISPALVRDARGYESQFATNHLGHFHLTARLWPALRRTRGARVIALSSLGHARAPIDFDDWNFERRAYDPMVAYGQSKTANALFALALDARGADDDVHGFSVHPGGIITTGLVHFMSEEDKKKSGYLSADGHPVIDPEANMKSPEMGAATTVWCATSRLLEGRGGVYCQDCNIAEAVGPEETSHRGVRPWARDPAAAERLWTLSEALTGVSLS